LGDFLKILTRVLGASVIVVAVLSVSLLSHLPRLFPWLHSQTAVLDRGPTVVQKIRALSRLETVSYTEQKVLEGRKEWPAMPPWLLGDQMLFVAQGEVTAGVDLSKFKPEHLRWQGEAVNVRLPRPEVFHVSLDNRSSRVYHRSTGWLNKSDPQLETRVRQRADEVLLTGALEEGILDQARRNAEKEVGSLLKGFGAKSVTFM
jgi:hypothetical protein